MAGLIMEKFSFIQISQFGVVQFFCSKFWPRLGRLLAPNMPGMCFLSLSNIQGHRLSLSLSLLLSLSLSLHKKVSKNMFAQGRRQNFSKCCEFKKCAKVFFAPLAKN